MTKQLLLLSLLTVYCAFSQHAAAPQTAVKSTVQPDPNYRLGPGDEVVITVVDAVEIADLFANSFQIGSDGNLMLPMIGQVRASGLTLDELQIALGKALKRYILQPQVSVSLKTVKSQPFSVLGAANTPGVHQLDRPETLGEALAQAGGLSKEAGYKLLITREQRWGPIPGVTAVPDATGAYTTAEISTKELQDPQNPKYNILVRPNDVITIPRAETVYVIGEVKKPGGFTLGEHRNISALQALSLAEGLTATASPGKAIILRQSPQDGPRQQITVDLKKLMKGKAADVTLAANDILVVPDRTAKKAGVKIAETALQTISGVIIWRGI